MKISARNQLKGKIVEIHEGPISGTVSIDIGGGNVLFAHITEQSVKDLELKVGDAVTALITSSSILVGK
ncbi:TOBE domain-containing protein [Xanthobacter agilis]|jgi:molybdopterin-binding protein|uniref:Molybdopterin-binding protein n=1 Tax=Xanthobacter agilis TaxID=47492 RepID=A0ABU0LDS2_XANAG|nr:TOBE domain-containing protein [Xanthobacter agilis]MDQ0505297.1 molybdopterin-binding protein [Xanthobacter agilis]